MDLHDFAKEKLFQAICPTVIFFWCRDEHLTGDIHHVIVGSYSTKHSGFRMKTKPIFTKNM